MFHCQTRQLLAGCDKELAVVLRQVLAKDELLGVDRGHNPLFRDVQFGAGGFDVPGNKIEPLDGFEHEFTTLIEVAVAALVGLLEMQAKRLPGHGFWG